MTDRQKYRLLEMLPGLTIWSLFIGAIILSFLKPYWVIYFMILLALFWLMRIAYSLIFLIISWSKFRKVEKINWLARCQTLSNWQKIYHLIFLATYKEEVDVVENSFKSLLRANYPLDKLIVVLAGEERDQERFLRNAAIVQEKYGSKIFKFIFTLHPKNLPNEIPGKGSNLNWSGHRAKEIIDQMKIPYQDIVVSTFDIDTCVHPQYFAYLTYKYLTAPNPTRASYQPVAIFNNNIWESPAISRVVSRGTTFWLLSELAKPDRLFTFSSHSMSFRALVDIDFWQKDVVSEDSRIFLQCFNYYNGDYRVEPLYISVSMDTVYCGSFWRTIINQYRQQRRWAYGMENFPYMAWYFVKNKKMPWTRKLPFIWKQFEGGCSWASSPILILIFGWLPIWIAGQRGETAAVIQNAPFILEQLLTISMVGLFVSAILSTALLPPRPTKYKSYKYFFMIIQWLLFPVTMIIFGAVPATEALSRLMLGKYLGFHVTEKQRNY